MDPDFEKILEHAQVFESQGRPELAVPHLRRAAAMAPNSALVFSRLSRCLRKIDQFLEASECAQRCVQLRPDSSYAHVVLASVCIAIDRYPEAIKHTTEAIRLDPGKAWHYWPLANSYVELHRYSEAVELCRRGLAIDPAEMTLRHHLAWGLAGAGEAAEALDVMRAFLADSPNSATGHGVAGYVSWHLGLLEQSAGHFTIALRRDPTDYWTREGLATVHFDRGDWQSAEDLFSEALRINPYLRRARLLLDEINRRRGDYLDGQFPAADSRRI